SSRASLHMARLPKIGNSSPAPAPLQGDGAASAAEPPPSRPRFLPQARWAKWALAFLLVFTLVRGGMWAMTQPYFWAPDEDYHYLYVEYLTTQHPLPSPDNP